MRVIIRERFNVRESNILIDRYLKADLKDRAFVLENIKEFISQLKRGNEIYDVRLSVHGNKILKTTEILKQQLNIMNSQLRHKLADNFSKEEKVILAERFTDLRKQIQYLTENINKGGYYER